MNRQPSLLLVANYDSGVGYAWWLMESFWRALAERYAESERVLLAYPSISTLPESIATAPLTPLVFDFSERGFWATVRQASFLRRKGVRTIYLTDQEAVSLRYLAYRIAGVHTIVVHDHTPGERSEPRGIRRFIKGFVAGLSPFAATGLIAATNYVSQRHRRVSCFPSERCFVAQNGLPDGAVLERQNLAVRFGVPEGRRVIVSVGRAAPIKGIEVALRALLHLRTQLGMTDVHYIHIGDGPELERLKSLSVELGVADFVSYPGAISDVPAVLSSCDVALHPSFGEVGYSLSILEFMRAGLPVVVSDLESVRGATRNGETGLLFEPGSAVSAATALAALLSDEPRRRAMGAAAQADIRDRFSLAKTHLMLIEAMESIRILSRE